MNFINEAIKNTNLKLQLSKGTLTNSSLIPYLCNEYGYPLLSLSSNNYSQSSIPNDYSLEPGQSQGNVEIQNIFNGFRRIFTGGDFACGGRYYDIGWFSYQYLSQHQRSKIMIDDQPTVELDFSNMFLMMLYHREGIDYSIDGYEIDGYERENVKKAVNILFNTTSKESALKAFRFNGISGGSKLVDLIEQKHDRLKNYFYTTISNNLMRSESDLATEIMKTGITEGIVSLPIHDSFIIQQKHKTTFESIMSEVYRDKFKYKPRIKSKSLIN